MADFFYFIASLPTLRKGEKTPFTYAAFLENCENSLGAKHADALKSLRLLPNAASNSDFGRKWYEYEAFLRNTVAQIRVAKLRKGTAGFSKRETPWLSPADTKAIEDAMALASPLDRENALDNLRWSFLDNVADGHFFDFQALEVYAVKLLILEKQADKNPEKGKNVFNSMLDNGLKQAQDGRIELD